MSIFNKVININSSPSNDELALIQKQKCKVIVGKKEHDKYGLYGDCYSQPKDFVEKVCQRTSKNVYETQTESHKIGQSTVNIVLSALNALPNVEAWPTPSESEADIHWKWDLIIKHENYFYPVQVKSSKDAIDECVEHFRKSLEQSEYEKCKKIQEVHKRYEDRIHSCMTNNYIKSRQDPKIVAIFEERREKIQVLESQYENYENAYPMFIWASHDQNTIKALVRVFAKLFNIEAFSEDLEDKALKLYSEMQVDIIFEKEKSKNKYMSKIITNINNYLNFKKVFLAQQNEIYTQTGKVVLLQDILSVKIADNALKIAIDILKCLEDHLEELMQNSEFYIWKEDYKRKQILSCRDTRIQLGSCHKNKRKDTEHKALDSTYIKNLYEKINKLMCFDNASSKPMFIDILNLLEDIETFADKYSYKVIKEYNTPENNLPQSTFIDFIP